MLYINLVILCLIGLVSGSAISEENNPISSEQSSKGCPLRRHHRHSSAINPNASCESLRTVYELTKQFQAAVSTCDWPTTLSLSSSCLLVDTIGSCPNSCCYISETVEQWINSYGECDLRNTQFLTQPPRYSTVVLPDGLIVVRSTQIDTFLGIPPTDKIWSTSFFWRKCCDNGGAFKLMSMKMMRPDCLEEILDLENVGQLPVACQPDCL